MKILNLYAGIGGNRKLWGDEHELTAVEYKEDIAQVYRDRFPDDIVIIADAHEYLIKHYKEFDFIWASPPCPTHSRIRASLCVKRGVSFAKYPDMKLYQEIIFLNTFFNGLYCIENVIPYYKPLIEPTVELNRHLFWANFRIPKIDIKNKVTIEFSNCKDYEKVYGIDLSKYKFKDRKQQILRNCVDPETAEYILNCAIGKYEYKKNHTEINLFGTPPEQPESPANNLSVGG